MAQKRGPKPKGKVKISWSSDFAYAIGLIATDGNLSKDGRHINLTSKDREQIVNFQKALGVTLHIGRKSNGGAQYKKYYVVQIGDVLFYNFLISIGVTSAKSKTIKSVKIPDKFFFDFLRGCFDGDGSVYSYFDPRWRLSFMYYIVFASASTIFVDWLRKSIKKHLAISGHITSNRNHDMWQLRYAKSESNKLIQAMYTSDEITCLSRKRLKIKKILAIVGRSIKVS